MNSNNEESEENEEDEDIYGEQEEKILKTMEKKGNKSDGEDEANNNK